ncbi:similarity with cytochrome c-type biogenesis protein CcdA [hydrothermal vent metagenome]|uniref:Similarity with cytochrome c-type biogenesis protein CcdA n=1 Tax=hydrothermal vent metagenome TaxID=652676 RepID=A0A1W1C700_9ZZZZ
MKSIIHYAKEILFIIITVTILTNIVSLYRSQSVTDSPLKIESIQLIDGSIYKIPSKKPILLHFWATWCPVCKAEASNIAFLAKHFEVITVAVKSGDDAKIHQFLKEHNYHFQVFNDKNGALASQFHISVFPTTFIYDKEHKVAFRDVGYSSTLALYLKMLWSDR